MRKQTKLWTTKNGKKIRICDMTNGHLINSINFIEKLANVITQKGIVAGYSMLSILQGECAIDDVSRELNYLEEYGIDPEDINPLYENLCNEAIRRDLEWTRK